MEHNDNKFIYFLDCIFEPHGYHNKLSVFGDIVYILLIFASIAMAIIAVTPVYEQYKETLEIIEYCIVGFFVIEWISCLILAIAHHGDLPVGKAIFYYHLQGRRF